MAKRPFCPVFDCSGLWIATFLSVFGFGKPALTSSPTIYMDSQSCSNQFEPHLNRPTTPFLLRRGHPPSKIGAHVDESFRPWLL
jgi:hypothetical protein